MDWTSRVFVGFLLFVFMLPKAKSLKQYKESCIGRIITQNHISAEESNLTTTFTDVCDPTRDLHCVKGHCICKSYATYNPEKQKCLLNLLPAYYDNYNPDAKYACSKCPEQAECVTINKFHEYFSYVPVESMTYCICANHTVPDIKSNQCLERKQHGETCLVDGQCIPISAGSHDAGMLKCSNVCQCPIVDGTYDSRGTYDPVLKLCTRNPGQACGVLSYSDRYNGASAICIGGLSCGDTNYDDVKTCNCPRVGMRVSPDGTKCVSGYLENCGSSDLVQCDNEKGLKCIGQQCRCESSKYQKYDTMLTKCVYKLGSVCPQVSDYLNQTQTPICQKNAYCRNGRCECITGYSPEKNNTKCYKDYDQPCFTFEYNTCNPHQGLVCIHNRCLCSKQMGNGFSEFYAYDQKSRRCNYSDPIPTLLTKEDLLELHKNMSDYLRTNSSIKQQLCNNHFSQLALLILAISYFYFL